MSWKIELPDNVKLPEGFQVEEDADLVYLLFEDKEVAVFSRDGVNPEAVKETAREYIEKN